jgi:ADP-ribose pyrophosphatase
MHIRDLSRLTDEKWVNLFAATYEHNGHVGRWVFASRHARPHQAELSPDAVIIVPILLEEGQPRRLVFIREFRVPAGGYVYGLPAGLVEPGEPIEDSVRRELREETGLEVQRVLRVSPPLYSSAGLTDEANALAVVEVSQTATGQPALEATEEIEMVLLDFDAVCRLCDDATARIDAKAWMVLYLCQQLGRIF